MDEKIERLLEVYEDICKDRDCKGCPLNVIIYEEFGVCTALDILKVKYDNKEV